MLLIVFLCLLVLSETRVSNILQMVIPEDRSLNFCPLASKFGRECEEFDVETQDGYTLKLFHLKGQESGKPVLLMHGLLESADLFILRGHISIAVNLSETGYDVWAGNNRGNKYSRRNVFLPADEFTEENSSFHEIAIYDLPAIIDFVLEKTSKNKLAAIGHSQGTTMFYVLGSVKPEYNNKISVLISLAPVAYLTNTGPGFIALINLVTGLGLLGYKEVLQDNSPENNIIKFICRQGQLAYDVCAREVIESILGDDPEEFEPEFFNTFLDYFPAGALWKSFAHYAQIQRSGHFAQYDYGIIRNQLVYNSPFPPAYNLSRVTMPVALEVGRNDGISVIRDAERLMRELPNVVSYHVMERKKFNHGDFIYGKHLDTYMTPVLRDLLSKFVQEPEASIKEKCVDCFKGPNLIKTVVIIVCIGVVIQQIVTCINKMIDIPITTYTHFDFNRTIVYPSITFCREPPYKFEKLLDYGLIVHPWFTSAWRNFNFSAVPLDKLWNETTYGPDEFFAQYGLNGESHNVEVKETIGFVYGRCYTLSPKILSTRATRESGFSITLQHHTKDASMSVSTYPPGYHAFIHYTREPFTEVAVYNGGLVDYLYCKVGESIDVKLSVNQYVMISEDSEPCANEDSYSANTCTTKYVWENVVEMAGCSGPWIVSDLPPCDNFESMRNLIIAYLRMYQEHNCTTCPRYCTSYLYNGFVTDRHMYEWDQVSNKWSAKTGGSELQTQVYAYFNSMMVSVYEERYNYDWNLFLSDLGGSIGFLLGLSVIGLMSMFGKLWRTFIKPIFKVPRTTYDEEATTTTSVSKTIYQNQEIYDYCKKMNWKNLYY